MHEFEREYHVARLIAGGSSFVHDGVRYRTADPGRDARLEAAEVQRDAFREAVLSGARTHEQLVLELMRRGLWGGEDEERMSDLVLEIDDLKADLYKDRERESFERRHREALKAAKAELAALEARKRALDHQSAETYARSAHARYLAGSSLLQNDGRRYWPDRTRGWDSPDAVVEAAMRKAVEDRLGLAELRELARCEHWQQYWNARMGDESPFDAAAVDLNDEQRILAGWSRLYEGVAQRQDGPPRSAFDDDDLFDGWLILERRKRSNEDAEARFRKEVGGKIAGMNEVFMMMNRDAKKGSLRSSPAALARLNDAEATRKKEERMAYLKKHKRVEAKDMPDTARDNYALFVAEQQKRLKS